MKNITLVRTHYSHWASRSGYCLLSEYLQKSRAFTFKEIVTRNDRIRSGNTWKDTWRSCGMPWYSPEDHLSECMVHEECYPRRSDLVHFFDGEKGYYYSQTLSRKKNARVVATYHQPPSVMDRYGLLGDKGQLEHLDRLVILSESQRSFFEDHVAPDRIVCIPHGVDTAFYRPARERVRRRRKFRCLSVGFWLRDLMVMERVIRAFRERSNVVFQIVGLQAGAENEAVDRTIYASLKKCPNVRLYENIEDGKLLELYQSADVLFLPLTDCTANNVLLEALSCGLPILTTDHSGTRYYLDNDGACFARPGDVKDTVERLRAIVSQDEMRKTLSERGRQRAEERYAWEKIALRYHELYKEILNKPRKPRRRDLTLKKAMCTVVSSDFLQQALALYLSATKHGDCDFFILVADDHHDAERFREVQQRVNGRLTLLRRRDLQRNLAFHYDEDSLRWALKPSLMLHLLETLRYDAVMFADNDVCFFESYDFLFKELERSAVLLTPHWRPINPEENLAQFTCNFSHGLYNAGFIGASRKGVEALRWWEHVCKVRCEKREGEGFYVDQRYLDALPVYFDGVRVLDHKGCNVAEWNAEHLPRVAVGGKSFVEIWPIVFIHFTGLTIKRIDENRDPALEAYLETYRKLLNEAERLMAQEELDLLEAMDRSPCEADVTEEKPEASPTASIDLCVAVDFMNIPNFLLQLESIRTSFRVMPTVWALCADYESYDFLKRLKDRVELVVWRELKSYRLEKLRKRYENCQTGFTLGATPFFLGIS